ncbi:MAG: UDP-N-acetylmuramoyl-L-alanyl-D-glutamate--2,6-diaminopimelate ligase [Rhodospirillales bacterium]|nr:UDP-N-acetylmuramoyl-L-alanyl-D-glutamate--2,6-diaminopimelate ligase [Rhodospirillales bacterium]
MKLSSLLDHETSLRNAAGRDPEIAGVTADSRKVERGYLFAALAGSKSDGRAFVGEALRQGAAAVLAAPGLDLPAGVPYVEAPNPRRAYARAAARHAGGQPRTIVAVTGTSGKTSVASFTRQIWMLAGRKAASLGTLGLVAPHIERYGTLTTADPVELHADLASLARAGVDHVAMEASSHGLDQCRLDGVILTAAAYTNLSRDHLDYHPTMEAYFAAKRRLFDTLLPRGGVAVLNADAPEFVALNEACVGRGQRVIAYGHGGADLKLVAATPVPQGLDVEIAAFGQTFRARLKLAGAFQAMNVLAAAGLAIGSGLSPHAALSQIGALEGVPGRLELAGTKENGASVYVDYAHKPGALETMLKALRPHVAGRLWVVFGCGGDRDVGKRPIMGRIAHELADRVIVTDDNPRSEDPAAIRKAVLEGAPGAHEISPREDAIRAGVEGLLSGDVLVIAGKGHERGQIVAGKVLPFDDREQARAALAGGGA